MVLVCETQVPRVGFFAMRDIQVVIDDWEYRIHFSECSRFTMLLKVGEELCIDYSPGRDGADMLQKVIQCFCGLPKCKVRFFHLTTNGWHCVILIDNYDCRDGYSEQSAPALPSKSREIHAFAKAVVRLIILVQESRSHSKTTWQTYHCHRHLGCSGIVLTTPRA